jgi:hypothetical protein
MSIEVHPPGDWSQEDVEEETPLVRKADYDRLLLDYNVVLTANQMLLERDRAHLNRIADLEAWKRWAML